MALNPFDNLAAEVTELPGQTRVRHEGPNPFKELLTASYTDRKGRKVTLPAEHVSEAQRLIRRAADQLNIGARIVVDNGKKDFKCTPEIVKEWADKKSQAKVTVMFEAKERRVHKKKETAPVVETPAAPVAAPAAPAASTAPAAQ